MLLAAVADARGFGRAVERLGMTQSGVSKAIAKLESRLGEVLNPQSGSLRFARGDGEGADVAAGVGRFPRMVTRSRALPDCNSTS